MGAWFVTRVLPGLVTGVPYMVIGGGGLWLQLRHSQRHLARVTDAQTTALSQVIAHHAHPEPPHR